VSTHAHYAAAMRGQDRHLCATPFLPIATSAYLKCFQSELILRLQRGEHVVLYGPVGSGKSTLLAEVHRRIAATGAPCAVSTATSHLEDVTRALTRAYPEVNAASTRRRTRGRLWLAADRKPGVLIFDHVTRVGTAMVSFLRRLRGGVAGVLLAFDVEKESERLRLRGRHLGRPFLPMPLASNGRLQNLLRKTCAHHRLPRLTPSHERRIIQAARGRVGWIARCTRLILHERYWTGATLHVAVLCIDTEIALRQPEWKLLPFERKSNAHARHVSAAARR
jgi:energy-coupling factor transporter ATP-binding protein EcfA2